MSTETAGDFQANPANALPVYSCPQGAGSVSTSLNITAAKVLKAGPGAVLVVTVVVAGSAPGTVNDCATTGAAAAANQVATIPNTVGSYAINVPCVVGIVVPGSGQTLAVSNADTSYPFPGWFLLLYSVLSSGAGGLGHCCMERNKAAGKKVFEDAQPKFGIVYLNIRSSPFSDFSSSANLSSR
jgi:hypothetical protein